MSKVSHGETIIIIAAVQKVQTLVDKGIRVTLDMPETAIVEAAWLMTCLRDEEAVEVTVRRQG